MACVQVFHKHIVAVVQLMSERVCPAVAPGTASGCGQREELCGILVQPRRQDFLDRSPRRGDRSTLIRALSKFGTWEIPSNTLPAGHSPAA
jgi:hypothetical protein